MSDSITLTDTQILSISHYLLRTHTDLKYAHMSTMSQEDRKDALNALPDSDKKSLLKAARVHALHHPYTIAEGLPVRSIPSSSPLSVTKVNKELDVASRYGALLADNADPDDWNEVEWSVRMEYVRELTMAKKRGGCTGCVAGSIRRRYLRKLQDLL